MNNELEIRCPIHIKDANIHIDNIAKVVQEGIRDLIVNTNNLNAKLDPDKIWVEPYNRYHEQIFERGIYLRAIVTKNSNIINTLQRLRNEAIKSAQRPPHDYDSDLWEAIEDAQKVIDR